MNDQQIESEIQAKGLTAPRITPADIEANIVKEVYFTAAEGIAGHATMTGDHSKTITSEHTLLTFCVLTLRNGFTVTGESACASPENFDAEIGRKIARTNAVQKIWPLMGYELKCRLAREAAIKCRLAREAAKPAGFQDRVRAEAAELDERIKKLAAFLPSDIFGSLPKDEQDRLTAQLAAIQDYSGCLAERIQAFGGQE
jgi:hypothetical protein